MDKIEELLTRGVEKIYPSYEELEKVLKSGKKLKLYQGFDPTGIQLHIGHMVGLRKLRQWQDLGHHVIFLIGDSTATVGDPTGKEKARPRLTKEQVLNNARKYKEQASKLLRFQGENPIEIKYNSEWLGKMSGAEFMNLASLVSYNQIIERDMFQKRLQKNESIGVLELLYPILQGYDSVAMNVDLEIGGSDQTFNMLVGRTLVKSMLNKGKFVMTTPLLTDSKGVKIGKTEGNVIALTDKPEDLFGKIMALPDDIILKGFEYLTDIPMSEIENVKKKIEKGENPIIYKKKLAFEIVKQLNDEINAKSAEDSFRKTVQKGDVPIETIEIPKNRLTGAKCVDLFFSAGLGSSKSYIKRVLEQAGGRMNNQILKPNDDAEHTYKPENVYEFGRKKFKIKLGEERP